MTMPRCVAYLPLLLLAAIGLAACDGGEIPLGGAIPPDDDGPGATEPPPAGRIGRHPTNPVALSQLRLQWGAVVGAQYYHVLREDAPGTGWVRINAENVTGTNYIDVLPVHLTDWPSLAYGMEACNLIGGVENCTPSENVYQPGRGPTVGISTGLTNGTAPCTVPAIRGVVAYGKSSDPTVNYQFGSAIAMSGDGDTVAVAEHPVQQTGGVVEPGSRVYVYRRVQRSGEILQQCGPGSDWVEQARFPEARAAARDGFGYSVALSADGNTLAVGAPEMVGREGRTYVYRYDGTEWSEPVVLSAPNPAAGNWFGNAVALSGDGELLAVGSHLEDGGSSGIQATPPSTPPFPAGDSGAVYLYARNGEGWTPQAYIKADNVRAGSYFGWALAFDGSGSTLAVGAPLQDSGARTISTAAAPDDCNGVRANCAENSGAVYVYTRSDGIWSLQAFVKASNADSGDEFGHALALSADGNELVVGAPHEESNARLFRDQGLDTVGDDPSLPQNNNNSRGAGAAYLFHRIGAGWSQTNYLKAHNTVGFNTSRPLEGDLFGSAVAISSSEDTGIVVAVGAPQENSNSTGINDTTANNDEIVTGKDYGAVYIYAMRNARLFYIKESARNNNVTHSDDSRFGSALGLSADGFTFAAGAPGDDCTATLGISNRYPTAAECNPFDNAGAFYVY